MNIILNGVTSSGKSTIASQILQISETPFIYFNADFLIPSLLPHQDSFKHANKIESNFERDYIRKLNINLFRKIKNIPIYEFISVFEKYNLNVLIDTIILTLEDYIQYFDPLNTYMIKVVCPLNILIEREISRKDRKIGNAKNQFDQINTNKYFDLEIDSSKFNPNECAEQILKFINTEKPYAIKKWVER